MTNEDSPRLDLYERVKVVTNETGKAEVNGLVGTVSWPASRGKDGTWLYGVFICPDSGDWDCPNGSTWVFREDELQSTGEFGWEHRMALEHPPRYAFYEKVLVNTDHLKKRKLNGKIGVVRGRAQNEDGRWGYAVLVYGLDTVYYFFESELVTVGAFDSELEEADKLRPHIKVRVDEHGRGYIADDTDS